MRMVIAGGTGLLGTALAAAWRSEGHDVILLTRTPRHGSDVRWAADGDDWMRTLDGADAVINLAGESIAGRRWTAARKAAIRSSRVTATRALVTAIRSASRRPAIFVSSSAIGIYGTRGDDPVTEATPIGSDFLASVCRDWEREALEAGDATRVVLPRTGVVLSQDGGALPQLALPVRLFAGGPMATGRQYVSWIHIADWVDLIRWAVITSTVSGPVNATAPTPVTNAEFTRVLGRVLRRPTFLRAPAFALRLALGEMADALIIGGQRVLPAKAQALGFAFRYQSLEPALREIY